MSAEHCYRTKTGIQIGIAYARPPKPMGSEAETIQRLLLDAEKERATLSARAAHEYPFERSHRRADFVIAVLLVVICGLIVFGVVR